ncbi:MAG: YraN family protein [Halieaceae bacterium]|nr:YraN family protein [Halieaceae bacterium]MBT5135326.1 YraN family protein [Halieaceae bacterium]MBT6181194.1 YraN family protein [Halieaceae bacterium]MDG1799064.1 YraN family protein [Luminiphilus sp.]
MTWEDAIKSTGLWWERYVCAFLAERNVQIIDTNFHSRFGEIDVVALDQEVLVFIEVRFRRASRFGSAVSSVTPKKQHKIIQTAHTFRSDHPAYCHRTCRFDIIGIDTHRQHTQVRWLKAAFTATE